MRFVLLLVFLLLACGDKDRAPDPVVDDSFLVHEVVMTRGKGKITIYYQVRRQGDEMRACGAWTVSSLSRNTSMVPALLESASIMMGDTKLISDLRFMKAAKSIRRIIGIESNCRQLRAPWDEKLQGFQPVLYFPRFVWS